MFCIFSRATVKYSFFFSHLHFREPVFVDELEYVLEGPVVAEVHVVPPHRVHPNRLGLLAVVDVERLFLGVDGASDGDAVGAAAADDGSAGAFGDGGALARS